MALLHALKEQLWILRLLNELGYNVDDQNIIYVDSQSAIALAHNPEHHARTKHIDNSTTSSETVWRMAKQSWNINLDRRGGRYLVIPIFS